jgi:hypothetical protein
MDRQPQQHSDTDIIVMAVVGMVALGSVAAIAAVAWQKVITWCLAHGLLVSPDASPLLSISGGGGAGLDLSRILVAVAVVVVVLAVSARGVRRVVRRGEEFR